MVKSESLTPKNITELLKIHVIFAKLYQTRLLIWYPSYLRIDTESSGVLSSGARQDLKIVSLFDECSEIFI